ncbi:hypothetical protein ROZALSC1DRAFT_30264 [Rozella allomycis CSF55]|uniref:IC97/Casc1 N-terminal domain-containing protein n=1 Tax=Rozella allomycis (strain CSF55) TaxID=988480 RepID=A0A4P9YEV9_ROZAC|nr:hypothetical protein ROZALSC1DRAFT_30264 [Rozella allomycis CSF55]
MPSAKKSKKSKKDLERVVTELARLEQLRKEKEEKIRKEKELLVKRSNMENEEIETIKIRESQDQVIKNLRNERMEKLSWTKFMQCSRVPEPNNAGDVNTYIATWTEENVVSSDHSTSKLEPLLAEGEAELHMFKIKAIDENNEHNCSLAKELLAIMKAAINEKWNDYALDLLQFLDTFPRENSENLIITKSCHDHHFGLWANYTKNPRFKNFTLFDGRLTFDMPKPVALSSTAMICRLDENITAVDYFEHDDRVVDGNKTIVGGVLYLDLFEMPDQPRNGNGWTIRTCNEMKYPFSTQQSVDINESDNETVNENSQSIWQAEVKYTTKTGTFIHHDSLKLLYWDFDDRKWRSDGFSDIHVEGSTITFKTTNFKPTIVTHENHPEFPLQSWTLSSQGNDSVLLSLKGLQTQLEVSIFPEFCRLNFPSSNGELNENVKYTPSELLYVKCRFLSHKMLSYYGYNYMAPKSVNNIDPERIKRKVM